MYEQTVSVQPWLDRSKLWDARCPAGAGPGRLATLPTKCIYAYRFPQAVSNVQRFDLSH